MDRQEDTGKYCDPTLPKISLCVYIRGFYRHQSGGTENETVRDADTQCIVAVVTVCLEPGRNLSNYKHCHRTSLFSGQVYIEQKDN